MSNVEIDNYFGREVCYSRDAIPKSINSFCIINLDDKSGPGTHWVALKKSNNNFFYFDSFGAPPPEEIISMTKNNFVSNIYRVQEFNTNRCGYFCIDFINSVTDKPSYVKWLLNYDPTNFRRNDEIVIQRLYDNRF